MDTLYLELHGGGELGLRAVQCFFNDSEQERLTQLSQGQAVTVRGRCDGLMMNVLLKKCMFPPSVPEPELEPTPKPAPAAREPVTKPSEPPPQPPAPAVVVAPPKPEPVAPQKPTPETKPATPPVVAPPSKSKPAPDQPSGFAVLNRATKALPGEEYCTVGCRDLSLEARRTDKLPEKLPLAGGLAGLEIKGARRLELKVKASPGLESRTRTPLRDSWWTTRRRKATRNGSPSRSAPFTRTGLPRCRIGARTTFRTTTWTSA